MKDFGEFQIKPDREGFVGDKISINSILNVNIIVVKYKIENSKFEGKGKRLDLQIIFKNIYRVCWISSKNLIEMIEKVPKDGFPFTAKILKADSGQMVFTAAE
jgi:hypothetical protein